MGRVIVRGLLIGLAVASGVGCAGPSFTTRSVQQDAHILVGLARYADAAQAAGIRHDHPAVWTDAEVEAVLSRLVIQERLGLFQAPPPVKEVFTSEQVAQLSPGLREAFRTARPEEWIVFTLTDSSGSSPAVTSGVVFLMDRHLHVILANHRVPLSSGTADRDAVHANPVRPLRGMRGTLSFEPARYVTDVHNTWLGGSSDPSASELVLDHVSFLAAVRKEAPVPSGPVGAGQPSGGGGPADAALRGQLEQLKAELERVKQQLAEQNDELARLKSHSSTQPPR